LKDAAWYYPDPMEKAKHVKDYVAFCRPSPFFTTLSECRSGQVVPEDASADTVTLSIRQDEGRHLIGLDWRVLKDARRDCIC